MRIVFCVLIGGAAACAAVQTQTKPDGYPDTAETLSVLTETELGYVPFGAEGVREFHYPDAVLFMEPRLSEKSAVFSAYMGRGLEKPEKHGNGIPMPAVTVSMRRSTEPMSADVSSDRVFRVVDERKHCVPGSETDCHKYVSVYTVVLRRHPLTHVLPAGLSDRAPGITSYAGLHMLESTFDEVNTVTAVVARQFGLGAVARTKESVQSDARHCPITFGGEIKEGELGYLLRAVVRVLGRRSGMPGGRYLPYQEVAMVHNLLYINSAGMWCREGGDDDPEVKSARAKLLELYHELERELTPPKPSEKI